MTIGCQYIIAIALALLVLSGAACLLLFGLSCFFDTQHDRWLEREYRRLKDTYEREDN